MDNTNQSSKTNPLLQESPLKNRAVPFADIRTEHFMPALDQAIRQAKDKISALREDTSPANFENTIVRLETCSEDVDLVASIFFNLLNAETNDELQVLAQEFSPKISDFSNDILLDDKLFARVKEVYDKRKEFQLNTEQMQLLENTYTDFTRNGALLNEEQKQRLREIDQELSKLSPEFSQNVLKATNEFELWIEDAELLKGLPASAIDAAAHAAEEKQRKGAWLFTLDAPSYMPFMKFAEHRPSREKLWRAYTSRAFGGTYDNRNIVLRTVQLRHERAQLLGFKTYADFVLRKRMAESPERVNSFLNRLLDASLPAARNDVKEVQDHAKSMGGPDPLMPWDFAYYSEKLKEKKFSFEEEQLRPYFKLENVVSGVFEHARRLYGLEFRPSGDYPTYNKDVNAYEVYREGTGEFVGVFYTDFFPRPSKRGGAWMTNFYEQGLFKGVNMRPHVSIVCNFTKPTPTKPSLLDFNEVQTLFHEFGHSLHGLLSQCTYRSLAGTNVYWDFVELPSQILENWTLEKESLDLFARHYETGEAIPAELAQKIKESARFMAGYFSLRQLNFALLDMAWFSHPNPQQIQDVGAFEDQATTRTNVLPKIEGTNISCGFSHIFAGGYAAGYYSYKWAEVLDADAFELFQEKGLFNPDVAQSFQQNILARGGTEHPMELYKKFRGREPDPDALLRRDGLIQ